jgi:dihydroneopterin aldolase
MSDRIVLAGLVAEGRHGVHDWEREGPQPFIVDVELHLDLRPAGTTDDLALTADYSAVARRVRATVETRSFRLVEALAEAIATALLTDWSIAEEVVVRISKPAVETAGSPDGPMVEIHRRRDGQA